MGNKIPWNWKETTFENEVSVNIWMNFSKAKKLENWFWFNYFQIFLEKAHSNLPSTLKHLKKHFIGNTYYVTKKREKIWLLYSLFRSYDIESKLSTSLILNFHSSKVGACSRPRLVAKVIKDRWVQKGLSTFNLQHQKQ